MKRILAVFAAMMLFAGSACAVERIEPKANHPMVVSYEAQQDYEVVVPNLVSIPKGQKTGTCEVKITKADNLIRKNIVVRVEAVPGDLNKLTREGVSGRPNPEDQVAYEVLKNDQVLSGHVPVLMAASGAAQPVSVTLTIRPGVPQQPGTYEGRLFFSVVLTDSTPVLDQDMGR